MSSCPIIAYDINGKSISQERRYQRKNNISACQHIVKRLTTTDLELYNPDTEEYESVTEQIKNPQSNSNNSETSAAAAAAFTAIEPVPINQLVQISYPPNTVMKNGPVSFFKHLSTEKSTLSIEPQVVCSNNRVVQITFNESKQASIHISLFGYFGNVNTTHSFDIHEMYDFTDGQLFTLGNNGDPVFFIIGKSNAYPNELRISSWRTLTNENDTTLEATLDHAPLFSDPIVWDEDYAYTLIPINESSSDFYIISRNGTNNLQYHYFSFPTNSTVQHLLSLDLIDSQSNPVAGVAQSSLLGTTALYRSYYLLGYTNTIYVLNPAGEGSLEISDTSPLSDAYKIIDISAQTVNENGLDKDRVVVLYLTETDHTACSMFNGYIEENTLQTYYTCSNNDFPIPADAEHVYLGILHLYKYYVLMMNHIQFESLACIPFFIEEEDHTYVFGEPQFDPQSVPSFPSYTNRMRFTNAAMINRGFINDSNYCVVWPTVANDTTLWPGFTCIYPSGYDNRNWIGMTRSSADQGETVEVDLVGTLHGFGDSSLFPGRSYYVNRLTGELTQHFSVGFSEQVVGIAETSNSLALTFDY